MSRLDVDFCRKQFPALKQNCVLMDNAGGSATCQQVINRLTDYLTKCNVQPGAPYAVSSQASKELVHAHEVAKQFMNAERREEIVFGSSATSLIHILSICISKTWLEGDEIIVTNADHNANIKFWTDLRNRGITILTWEVDDFQLNVESLHQLLTPKTKLVAMTHVSSIYGSVYDIQEVAKLVHENGSLLLVDGTQYAPHRLIDVRLWDVDFYVVSCYKVFGTHSAIMYGKYELLQSIPGANYPALETRIPTKFQVGFYNYESAYSFLGIVDYLESLAENHYGGLEGNSRIRLKVAFEFICRHEQNLTTKLLAYLKSKPEVHVVGKSEVTIGRLPIVSFIVENEKSSEVAQVLGSNSIGVSSGFFSSEKPIEAAGVPASSEGVVRISLAHYNTLQELNRLFTAIDNYIEDFCHS